MLTVVLQLFPRKHWRQSCYRPLSDNSRCSARVAGPSCQRFWDSHRNTLGQSEGRCHFRLFHKVSLQVEDTESDMGCGGVVEICQITEFKTLPFFVVHSKEANSAQDLAALAALCWCSKDKARDAVCGTGIQEKELPAVRMEYKQAERHWP